MLVKVSAKIKTILRLRDCKPGNVVGIATDYGLDGPGIEYRWRRDFLRIQTGPGTNPASCTMGTGSFPRVKCGRGVLLTTHPFYCRGLGRVELYLYPLWATTGTVTGLLYLYLTWETAQFLPLTIKKHRPVLGTKICPLYNVFQACNLLCKLKFVFRAGIK